ncbi:MAG: hypothetical protein KIT84_09940 [Labilithrix sp.]|nr:hypothetical protein [Labilithrix sp.]MCW5811323.1 hypothetical protein [Labilithrix sp.]
MKLSFVSLAFAVFAVACAAPTDETESSTQDLVTVKPLGELTPSELETAAKKDFADRLALLTAAHPDVRALTTSNIGDFVERRIQHDGWSTNDVDHAFADTFRALLRYNEATELAVSELAAKFAAWLPTQIPAATLASGKVACDAARDRVVGSACARAERAKSIASAKKPRGIDMASFVADWNAEGRDGARMTNPVVLAGEPSVAEVKRLAGVSDFCRQRGWGSEAVDAFLQHRPDSLTRHAAALKGPGFAKRWYWSCGSDSWGEEGFALLDEHNQLWTFGSYSSE